MSDTAPVRAHPGAICSPDGAHGVTKVGTAMLCRIPPSGGAYPRWGRLNPVIPKTTRRRGGPPRKGTGLRRAAYQQLPEPGSHTVPLPDKLVDQLSETEIGVMRKGHGLVWNSTRKVQQRVVEKLKEAGLIDADGNTTTRGVDALRRSNNLDGDRIPGTSLTDRAGAVTIPPPAVDRSQNADTDWSSYSVCPICGTDDGEPCRDLRSPDSVNAVPHDGRPRKDPDTLKEIDQRVAGREAAREYQLANNPVAHNLRGYPERFVGKQVTVTSTDHGRPGSGKTYTGELAAATPIIPGGSQSYTGVRIKDGTGATSGVIWVDNLAPVTVHPAAATPVAADRAADAGTDWEAYGPCRDCFAAAGKPCRDMRTAEGLNATAHVGRPLTDAAENRVRVLREMEEEQKQQRAADDQTLRASLAGTAVAPDEAAMQRILDNPTLRDDYLRSPARKPAPAAVDPAKTENDKADRSDIPNLDTPGGWQAALRKWREGYAAGDVDAIDAMSDDELEAAWKAAADGAESASISLERSGRKHRLDRVAADSIADDRSADSGTDWSQYKACNGCGTGPGEPCLDLRGDGSYNAVPHDGRPTVSAAAGTPQEDVKDAIERLAAKEGGYVALDRLRNDLAGQYTREQIDQALLDLDDAQEIDLEPEANQKILRPQDRTAALRLGGEDRHLVAIRPPYVPRAAAGAGDEPEPVTSEQSTPSERVTRSPSRTADAETVAADIEQAYRKLAAQGDGFYEPAIGSIAGAGYVPISAIRDELGDRHPKVAVDAALDKMIERKGVRLEQSLLPLAPTHRDAAVVIANQPREIIRIAEDHSRDADTDWSRYDECPDCCVGAGAPCYNLRSPDDLISTPHDGRRLLPEQVLSANRDGQVTEDTTVATEPAPNAAVVEAEHLQMQQRAAGAKPAPLPPVDGHRSDKPLAENGWGYAPHLPVSYHDDGPIGQAVKSMGDDAHLDVDGEPLADVVGKIATDVVMQRTHPRDAIDKFKQVRDRIPAESQARHALDWAIEDIDVPETPLPNLPDGTPAPIRDLVADLHAIPLARGPVRGSDFDGEVPQLVALAEKFATGKTGGSMMVREVQNLANRRHESYGDVGKMWIDAAIQAAVGKLKAMPREALYPKH